MEIVRDTAPWPAPAKLNLMLHIVGRRADGYHLLQTVFQFLDYCDWLEIVPRSDGVIERINAIPGLAAECDLIVRAAHLLQRATGTSHGASMRIVKNLPLGGGLGGGSSDAATVLVALNHYWQTGLPLAELAQLGLQLGADVPVFIHGHAAWAEGVGEQLTPAYLPQPWFVVVKPNCAVSTAAIFNDPELTRNSPLSTIAALTDGAGRNDCAAVVFRRYPQVAEAAAWLGKYAKAQLTGTGACVFAAFEQREAAKQVLAQLPAAWEGFIAQGCNLSPLHQRLAPAQAATCSTSA